MTQKLMKKKSSLSRSNSGPGLSSFLKMGNKKPTPSEIPDKGSAIDPNENENNNSILKNIIGRFTKKVDYEEEKVKELQRKFIGFNIFGGHYWGF